MEALTFDEPDAACGPSRLGRVLDRLAVVAPEAARRAEESLADVLEDLARSSWPEVAWKASRLTDDGFPVEFSWSSAGRAVRWTAEACGPETPQAERLPRALDRFEALTGARIELDFPPPAEPKFGAWVGGRHDPSGGDRYKLYVEAGEPSPAWRAALDEVEGALGRRVHLRMAGLEAEGPVELYGRVNGVDWLALRRLFGGPGADRIEPVLRALTGAAVGPLVIPRTGGVSLALKDNAVAARFWFAPAQLICGGERHVPERLAAAAAMLGADLSLYRAIRGRHGMVGLGVAADGQVRMQVGTRPH